MTWDYIKLSKIATFKNGLNFSKDNFGEGLKVIGVSDFKDYLYPIYDELEQINPSGIVKSNDYLQENDILFVRSNGNRNLIGRSLLLKNLTEKVSHSGFTIRARIKSKDVFVPFYFYVFRSDLIRATLSIYGGGTNINNLNQGILNNLVVPKPPLKTQQKIAAILSTYDDLIENNKRRINLLEKMAEDIYREWFVRFRFPGWQNTEFDKGIPKGWRLGSIGNIYEVKSGFAFQSSKLEDDGGYPIIKIRNITEYGVNIDQCQHYIGIIHDKIEKYQLFEGDFIVAMTGAQIGKSGLLPPLNNKYFLNQRVGKFFLKLSVIKSNIFISLFAKNSYFRECIEQYAHGAAQPNISGNQIESIKIIIPELVIIKNFEDLVIPMYSKINILKKQNAILEKTKNQLLPRLISGKLSIENLNIKFPPSMQ